MKALIDQLNSHGISNARIAEIKSPQNGWEVSGAMVLVSFQTGVGVTEKIFVRLEGENLARLVAMACVVGDAVQGHKSELESV